MGCDIHLYTERLFEKKGEKPRWINCDGWVYNPYYIPDVKEEDEEGNENIDYWESRRKLEVRHIYDTRNYALFSMLAGVRDYSDNARIDDPRGLPDDVCPITKAESDDYGSDGHSHSWVTLRELRDFREENLRLKRSGMVSPQSAYALDNEGVEPDSWCQGTSDQEWVYREWTVENHCLDELIDKMAELLEEIFWVWRHREERNLEAEEKLRAVFWFDN